MTPAKAAPRNPPPPPEVVDSALDAVNMNDKIPVLRRFGRWADSVMHGDLGQTIENQPVNDELGRRMWVSLRLLLIGSIVGAIIGVFTRGMLMVVNFTPVSAYSDAAQRENASIAALEAI